MTYLYRVVDRLANDSSCYENGDPTVHRSMMRALQERDYLNEYQRDLAPFTVIRVLDAAQEEAK